MAYPFASRSDQAGAVLLVALLFILLLSIIALSAMRATLLEEKMAGNLRDRSIALQAAETALRDAEALLGQTLPSFTPACTNGLCDTGNAPDWKTYQWNDGRYVVYNTSPSPAAVAPNAAIPDVYQQPRYFIEYLGPASVSFPGCAGGSAAGFRIVARGWGQNPNTQVTLEEIFAKC